MRFNLHLVEILGRINYREKKQGSIASVNLYNDLFLVIN